LAVDIGTTATEGLTDWEVVTLSIDDVLDMGVVDFRSGGPGVEREVVEEKLLGISVVEDIGAVVAVAVIEELSPVIDA